MTDTSPAIRDPWLQLRELTPARLALGRSGASLPTAEVLRFGVDCAQARDAVRETFDLASLQQSLESAGFNTLTVGSQATDRAMYLRRPDLGRQLSDAGRATLVDASIPQGTPAPELVFVVADGLSARAAQAHALPLLTELVSQLPDFHAAPCVIATQARVALGDEIGECLGARYVAVLIGERPGLSSPDSLGIYLTADPRRGRTDAQRNCISNIRPEGLEYRQAAALLVRLLQGARRLGRTGVDLKDEAPASELPR